MPLNETMVSCAVLVAGGIGIPDMGASPGGPACFMVDLDVAGAVEVGFPSSDPEPQFLLSRRRLEFGLRATERWKARVALNGHRNTNDNGYIGPSAEAWQPRLQLVEIHGSIPEIGTTVVAGLIDDPWVPTANQEFGWREVSASVGQEQGWFDRSDLGTAVHVHSQKGFVRASLVFSTGEGGNLRERNDGKNVTGLVTVRPLAGGETPDRLRLTVMARDGSRGVDKVRDHRLGARITSHGPVWNAGLELTATQGVQGDAQRNPWSTSLWGDVQPLEHVAAFTKLDRIQQVPGTAEAGQRTAQFGVALVDKGPLHKGKAIAGIRYDAWDAMASPVAGQETTATSVYLMLASRFRLGFEVDGPRPEGGDED